MNQKNLIIYIMIIFLPSFLFCQKNQTNENLRGSNNTQLDSAQIQSYNNLPLKTDVTPKNNTRFDSKIINKLKVNLDSLLVNADTVIIESADKWIFKNAVRASDYSTNCTRIVINSFDYPHKKGKDLYLGDIFISINGAGFIAESKDIIPFLLDVGAEHIYSSKLFNAPGETVAHYGHCRGKHSTTSFESDPYGNISKFSVHGYFVDGQLVIQSWEIPFIVFSDPLYPLSFRIISGGGYMYLCGRGMLITRDKAQIYLLGMDDSSEIWLPYLYDKDPIQRQRSAEALGWLGQKDQDTVVYGLINALKDADENVRRNAAESLGRLGSEISIEALKLALKDSDEWTSEVAQESLDKIFMNSK